ncbi:MAG: efflux RND transporter periplasmic adaptor subunit [Bacteroidota bacterium]
METIILLTYSGIVWLIFKVFKVSVNKWTVTTAILGGFAMLGSMVVMMNYNHPYTSNARVYFVTTPIISNVTSQVTDVKVKEQSYVKKGDTLYTLDSTVFATKVKDLKARLSLANTRLQQSKRLLRAKAGSAYDVDLYSAEIRQLNAQLEEALWKVSQCVIKAPTDGLVSQIRVRPGMRSVEFPLRPLMSFAHNERFVVGAFPQNPAQRLKIGDEAEVIFDAIPGRVFTGEVVRIGEVISQGELQAFGTLNNFDTQAIHIQGSIPYVIELTDDTSEYFIPGGAKAQMAIYSEYMEPVKIMRKVLLRTKSWLNYLFGEH